MKKLEGKKKPQNTNTAVIISAKPKSIHTYISSSFLEISHANKKNIRESHEN